MYWEHGYTAKDIVDRLRLSEELVRAIIAKDYVETDIWNEDTNTYTKIRTARTRRERPQIAAIDVSTQPSTSKEDQIRQQLERIAQVTETPLRGLIKESEKK